MSAELRIANYSSRLSRQAVIDPNDSNLQSDTANVLRKPKYFSRKSTFSKGSTEGRSAKDSSTDQKQAILSQLSKSRKHPAHVDNAATAQNSA